MEEIKFETKLEAIEDLSGFDHAMLVPEYCQAVCQHFGISPNLTKMYDTRSEFKGLTLNGVNPKTGKEFKEGDYAMGMADYELSEQIAEHLGLKYPVMNGRGSRHTVACDAILESLNK